jgi:exonuclease III
MKFSSSPSDSIAYIIDEGLFYHILKGNKNIIDYPEQRCSILTLPPLINGDMFHIINTYAPPNAEHKTECFQNMQHLLNKLNITSTNSIILGDINDFTASYLDRWSSYSTSETRRGEVLNAFRKLKYYDMFRTLHPEWKCYSREGIHKKNNNNNNTNNSNTKVITSTRLDYILTAPSIINLTQCCVILDNYNIGSDHRPVFASITTDKAIPHIASKDRTSDLAESEPPLQC